MSSLSERAVQEYHTEAGWWFKSNGRRTEVSSEEPEPDIVAKELGVTFRAVQLARLQMPSILGMYRRTESVLKVTTPERRERDISRTCFETRAVADEHFRTRGVLS